MGATPPLRSARSRIACALGSKKPGSSRCGASDAVPEDPPPFRVAVPGACVFARPSRRLPPSPSGEAPSSQLCCRRCKPPCSAKPLPLPPPLDRRGECGALLGSREPPRMPFADNDLLQPWATRPPTAGSCKLPLRYISCLGRRRLLYGTPSLLPSLPMLPLDRRRKQPLALSPPPLGPPSTPSRLSRLLAAGRRCDLAGRPDGGLAGEHRRGIAPLSMFRWSSAACTCGGGQAVGLVGVLGGWGEGFAACGQLAAPGAGLLRSGDGMVPLLAASGGIESSSTCCCGSASPWLLPLCRRFCQLVRAKGLLMGSPLPALPAPLPGRLVLTLMVVSLGKYACGTLLPLLLPSPPPCVTPLAMKPPGRL